MTGCRKQTGPSSLGQVDSTLLLRNCSRRGTELFLPSTRGPISRGFACPCSRSTESSTCKWRPTANLPELRKALEGNTDVTIHRAARPQPPISNCQNRRPNRVRRARRDDVTGSLDAISDWLVRHAH